MNSWIIPSIISLVLYGFWGFLGTKAAQYGNAKTVVVLSCLGTMIGGLCMLWMTSFQFEMTLKGMSFSLLTGLATAFGTLMFIYALQRGPAIPIIMITALYPLVTVVLTILFLKESVTVKQLVGIVLSMFAIYCLTNP